MWKNYWKFYIYLGVILVLMGVGIVIQSHLKKRSTSHEELEEKFMYFRIGAGNSAQ